MLRSCNIGDPCEISLHPTFFWFRIYFFWSDDMLFYCFLLGDQFLTMRRESGSLTLGDLPSKMSKLKNVGENLTEEERTAFLHDSYQNLGDEVDFELFLRVNNYTNLTYLLTYILVFVF